MAGEKKRNRVTAGVGLGKESTVAAPGLPVLSVWIECAVNFESLGLEKDASH